MGHSPLTIGNGSWVSQAGARRLARRHSGHPQKHTVQTGTGPGDTRDSPFCVRPQPSSTHEGGGQRWGGREERQETGSELSRSGEPLRVRDTEMERDTELGREPALQRHRDKEKQRKRGR